MDNIPLNKDGTPDLRYTSNMPAIIPNTPRTLNDLSRMDKFIYYKFKGMNTYQAAKAAGYSESFCLSNAYQLKHKKSYQEKCKEYYKAEAVETLPKHVTINNNVIQDCLDNTDNIAKHRQILKEIREEAGVRDHVAAPPSTINIGSIQAIIASNAGIRIDKGGGDDGSV